MKKQDNQILRRIGVTLALILFACWFLFWPLNLYIESPGSADSLKSYVTMKNHPDKYKGSFMITSVYLQQARPATYLWAKLNPHTSIESADSVTGGENSATYTKVQDFYMQSAINEAIAVAYRAAGQQYTKKYLGIYVLSVQSNSKFKKQIQVGDTITKVNGRHFDTAASYQKYIASQKVGDKLTVTYLHNGKQKMATNRWSRSRPVNQELGSS